MVQESNISYDWGVHGLDRVCWGGLVFGLETHPLRMCGMGLSGQGPHFIMGSLESGSRGSKYRPTAVAFPHRANHAAYPKECESGHINDI